MSQLKEQSGKIPVGFAEWEVESGALSKTSYGDIVRSFQIMVLFRYLTSKYWGHHDTTTNQYQDIWQDQKVLSRPR